MKLLVFMLLTFIPTYLYIGVMYFIFICECKSQYKKIIFAWFSAHISPKIKSWALS